MCFAYIGWMFFFWFPTYLVEARGMSMGLMSWMGVILHGAGFVGILGGGAISDWLLRTGWSAQFARIRLAGIAVALSLPFLLSAASVPSNTVCVILLFLFYLLFASAVAGYTTVSIEFNPHFAGAIFGMINCLGSFAGILGPMTAGFMLTQSGNWMLPFFVATAVGVVCAAILLVVPIRPIQLETFAPAEAVAGGVVHH
jgi:ACS family glucarate transporter-like MFS transporter